MSFVFKLLILYCFVNNYTGLLSRYHTVMKDVFVIRSVSSFFKVDWYRVQTKSSITNSLLLIRLNFQNSLLDPETYRRKRIKNTLGLGFAWVTIYVPAGNLKR